MKFITKFDILLILFLFIVVFTFNIIFTKSVTTADDNAKVVIYYKDEIYDTFPLNVDTTVTIKTDIGENVLQIKDGYADMIEADCKDKYDVHQKPIMFNNETIVCLPNKIVVTIKSDDESEIDSFVR